jgi:hypothetical protein
MTAPVALNSRFLASGNSYWGLVGTFVNALNGRDPDGGTVSFSLAPGGAPDFGRLRIAPDGTFVFRPSEDGPVNDSFTYRVTDSSGDTATATLQVTVRATAPATIEGLIGNDILLADGGANTIYGRAGADYLDGDGGGPAPRPCASTRARSSSRAPEWASISSRSSSRGPSMTTV